MWYIISPCCVYIFYVFITYYVYILFECLKRNSVHFSLYYIVYFTHFICKYIKCIWIRYATYINTTYVFCMKRYHTMTSSIYYELQLCTLILYSACAHTHREYKYFIFKHKTAINFLNSYLQLLSEGNHFRLKSMLWLELPKSRQASSRKSLAVCIRPDVSICLSLSKVHLYSHS